MAKTSDKICAECCVEFVDRSRSQSARFCSVYCRTKWHSKTEHRRAVARKYDQTPERREAQRLRNQTEHSKRVAYEYEHNEARRESNRKRAREYRAAHLESARERIRIYRQTPEGREAMRRAEEKRRARENDVYAISVSRKEIFARDNYTCQLCGKKVKMDKMFPHPLSPSIDHILPLSKGGTHEPRNVQLAHLLCNLRKSNIGIAQLRLLP